jgi:ATP-binding cassette subfamily B protein
MTLLKLIWQFIKPHWRLLAGVVIFQLAQSIASLYLPTLNAQIIDKGVATGNTEFILSTGALMLGITFVQVICAIIAVYFGAKAAMGLGRDLRAAVFFRVGEYSEREVSFFGAPSLITRTTNDVQQVQMLVLLTCTILVSASGASSWPCPSTSSCPGSSPSLCRCS